MEVDEATQATEENVQRHVNALTGAHLEAVIDTLEVLTGPWPGIVAKGQQAADAKRLTEINQVYHPCTSARGQGEGEWTPATRRA